LWDFYLNIVKYSLDTRPYQEVFEYAFPPWPQGQTSNSTYYNLLHFIEHGGAPLDSNRSPTATHVFVSTALNAEPGLDYISYYGVFES